MLQQLLDNMSRILARVVRILTPGGHFISIKFFQPRARIPIRSGRVRLGREV